MFRWWKFLPIIAAIITLHDSHLDACFMRERPKTIPEVISNAIQEKQMEYVIYESHYPLWPENTANVSEVLQHYPNLTTLTIWDFVNETRPIQERLSTAVRTVKRQLCDGGYNSDPALAFVCSVTNHSAYILDSLDLAESVRDDDEEDEDWSNLVAHIMPLSPVNTTDVSMAITYYIADKYIMLAPRIYGYQDRNGIMRFIRDLAIEAIIGQAHLEDVTQTAQYISDLYFREDDQAPSVNFFNELHYTYLRNAMIAALDHSNEVETAMAQAIDAVTNHDLDNPPTLELEPPTLDPTLIRQKRRAMRRRPRPPLGGPKSGPKYKPRRTISQEATRSKRLQTEQVQSMMRADKAFAEYWAAKAAKPAVQAKSPTLTQATEQATQAASRTYTDVISGKNRNFLFFYKTTYSCTQ